MLFLLFVTWFTESQDRVYQENVVENQCFCDEVKCNSLTYNGYIANSLHEVFEIKTQTESMKQHPQNFDNISREVPTSIIGRNWGNRYGKIRATLSDVWSSPNQTKQKKIAWTPRQKVPTAFSKFASISALPGLEPFAVLNWTSLR